MRRLALRPPPAPATVVVGVLLAAIAFYTWTVATSASLHPGTFQDPYNELVDGFAHGHLYLPLQPDPHLATLRDPYDPSQNAPYVTSLTRDLVYHHHRLYAYWGAAPALVAFWPFRILGVGDLPPGLATLVFSVVGLLCAVGLLLLLVRRHLPRTPAWMLGVATAVLGFGSMAPWVLRRPEAYEVAISAAFAFFWAGTLLVAAAFPPGRARRPWALAGASLCYGLAFASRPPLGIGLVFAAGAVVLLWRAGQFGDRRELARWAALALGPAAACVVAVAVYNAARFGSPGDFGTSMQLAGSEQNRFWRLAYVPPGLWFYLLYPARLTAAFPYFWVNTPHIPFPHSASYDAAENTAGLLPTVPFVVLLALARPALRGAPATLRRAVPAAAGVGLFLIVFTSFFYWGSVMRYEMDYGALFVMAAALVWFAFAAGRRRRAVLRGSAIAGTLLAAVSVVVVAAISLIGSDDLLRMRHPQTFASLQRFFSPVSAFFADFAGHPIIASVGGSPLAGADRYDGVGVRDARFFLGTGAYPLLVVSSGRSPTTLQATVRRLPSTPHMRLLVQARSPDGSVSSAQVDDGRVALPLSVRRGSNEITLELLAARPAVLPVYADSADDGGVLVAGLRLGRRG